MLGFFNNRKFTKYLNLIWILKDVIIWANLELKVSLMVGSQIHHHWNEGTLGEKNLNGLTFGCFQTTMLPHL